MQEYVCVHPCFWESLIEEGQVITVENDEQIPLSVRPFFKSMTENCQRENEIYGRSPASLASFAIAEIKGFNVTEEKDEENVDEIERLRMELESFGKAFDRRWGRAKLENVLTLAKRDANR